MICPIHLNAITGARRYDMGKDEETEELIKIFVSSIKTAEKKPRLGVVECSVLDVCFSFDHACGVIRCSMLDVHFSK